MKTILLTIEKFAKEKTNNFIMYVLIATFVLFYVGFVLGRSFALWSQEMIEDSFLIYDNEH